MSTCDLRISTPTAMACTAIVTVMDIPMPSPIQPPPMKPRRRARVSKMANTFTCAVVVGMLLLAQAGTGYAQQASSSAQESAAPALKIGAGDLIEVTVF